MILGNTSESYGLIRDELRYILDPKDVYGPNFPGETFRVLKEKEGCAVEGRGCKYAFDWRALHEVVFEALGLTKEEQLEVYREVASLVEKTPR